VVIEVLNHFLSSTAGCRQKQFCGFFYETSMELIHIPVFTIISLSDALEYYSAVVKSAGELLDNPVLFR
jgi:hypothetical protein